MLEFLNKIFYICNYMYNYKYYFIMLIILKKLYKLEKTCNLFELLY